MYAETLRTNDSGSRFHAGPARHGLRACAKAAPQSRSRAVSTQPILEHLTVVLSGSEPHRDVAVRAQLVARDTPVLRTTVVTKPTSLWERIARAVSRFRNPSDSETDVSARVLGATFPPERTRILTGSDGEQIVRQGTDVGLVLVGRRRKRLWLLEPLARYARRLLRRSRAPVLVVGGRPTAAYRNVVIATALESDVDSALKWVKRVAPDASVTFLHAYRGLFEGKLQLAGVPVERIAEHRREARQKALAGMAALLGEHGEAHRAVVAHGWTIPRVLRRARELDADLIVVAKSTRSRWAELLGASVSTEIARRADRDVLVVHAESTNMAGACSDRRRRRTQ